MTKPKPTHKKVAAKKQTNKKKAQTTHALIVDRDTYSKRPAVHKGKGKRKRKNDDDNDDDDDDQLQKNRKESNQDNIDDYLKYHSDLKPSSKLLKDYAEIDSSK